MRSSRSGLGLAFWLLGLASLPVSRAKADLDLILYGATGCVGHFAAQHLASQTSLRWAIAGRSKAKLDALVADLEQSGFNASIPEVIVAELGWQTSLDRSWVSRAKAVITTAGPYSLNDGEALVKACAQAGVHYADTSDEFYWQRDMIDKYDRVARKRGAKITLAGGFCVLAGDLGSQLAIEGLHALDADEIQMDAWLETYNGGLSAGVINTGRAILNASYPEDWGTDPYVLAPLADESLRLDTRVEGMSFPQIISGEGLVVPNLFGPYDARLLRRSYALLGQKVRLRVGAAASMYAKWTAFLASHPGSWSEMSKCPSQSVFNDGSWAYRFKGSSRGIHREVLLTGRGDPGYRFTAHGLAETGLCLAGKTQGCLKAHAPGGVMTSMGALDAEAFLRRLESVDLIEVEVKERRKTVRSLQ
mmetsp:Transcript_45062/g.107074  ORF Transcript_45062/g.107074 Transcript_45062/m.107074 type:complete len:419 (-) Transcript_45062:38-1294(-)